MDRETKVAYEIVRQRIVENLDRLEDLQAKGVKVSGDVNSLKRWRRYGAAFTWDPSVFEAVLAKPDAPDKQLLSLLRKGEESLMKRWGVIDKIPLHHVVANRTGGDLGIRTPVDTWLETRQRIFDATGAKPGDGPSNLNAASQFDELAHLGRTGAKGSVFADTGIERRADFPVLHRAGQNLAAKAGEDPKLVLGTAKEQAEVLIPSVQQQQARFAETTATPEVQAQRQVLTKAGYPEAFLPDTPIERIEEIATEIRGTEIPKQFAEAFDFSRGTAKLGLNLSKFALPAAAGGVLLSGMGAQAAEKQYQEDPSFIHDVQRKLAATELAADTVAVGATAAAPVTAGTSLAVAGGAEVVSMGAGLMNMVIDGGKAFLKMVTTPQQPTEEDLDFSTL